MTEASCQNQTLDGELLDGFRDLHQQELPNRHSDSQASIRSSRHLEHTVLETCLEINTEAKIPKSFNVYKEPRILSLSRGDEFDLGEHGRLKVVSLFHRGKGLMLKWKESKFPMIQGTKEFIRENYFKMAPRKCHRERVVDDDLHTKAISIHITSHPQVTE